MPIQPINLPQFNFEQLNPALAGARYGMGLVGQNQDILSKMLAQQKAQAELPYIGGTAKANLEKLNLANQWNPKIWQSEIGLRGAQQGKLGKETKWYDQEIMQKLLLQQAEANKTNYLLKNPGFMGGEETKNLEALKQMGLVNQNYQASNENTNQSSQMGEYTSGKNQPVGNEKTSYRSPSFDVNGLVQALINKPMTDLQYKKTLTQAMQQNLQGKAYTSMPAVEKEYALSQARAFGYTGEQASRMFNQGYDLSSMAKTKGYDPQDTSSWPVARGAPTTAIQTRIQRANSTLSALDAVMPEISEAYAKYSPRFKNVSPALIKDMLTGENQDDQANALAAYALYPEISALRINAQGGNVGEGAIQGISDAAFSRFNTLGISPNSYVFQKAQKRISQLIRKMNKAENSAIYGQRNASFEEDDKNTQNSNNSDVSRMSDEELLKIAGEK